MRSAAEPRPRRVRRTRKRAKALLETAIVGGRATPTTKVASRELAASSKDGSVESWKVVDGDPHDPVLAASSLASTSPEPRATQSRASGASPEDATDIEKPPLPKDGVLALAERFTTIEVGNKVMLESRDTVQHFKLETTVGGDSSPA